MSDLDVQLGGQLLCGLGDAGVGRGRLLGLWHLGLLSGGQAVLGRQVVSHLLVLWRVPRGSEVPARSGAGDYDHRTIAILCALSAYWMVFLGGSPTFV